MDDHEYLELERLKKENRYLRKELERYKNTETNNPIENFLNENIEILIKPVESLNLSVRTLNCLKNENINNIGDLIQLSEQFLLKSQNFGIKSLNELREILNYYNLNFNTRLENWPPENLDEKIKIYINKEIENLEVDAESLLGEIKNILSEREHQILKERFWKNKTLNEIGISFNVTRERIRQFEFQALRKIRIVKKNYLLAFLKKNEDKIFNKYSEDQTTIRENTLQKINGREKLPRMLELMTDEDVLTKIIIRVLYENIYEYLNDKYSVTDYGWKK
jgi:hypothetical protein